MLPCHNVSALNKAAIVVWRFRINGLVRTADVHAATHMTGGSDDRHGHCMTMLGLWSGRRRELKWP